MKNKGFTLVELIAVLIILAIISLIVAPLILNTVRRVKNDTNKRSIDGYGRAAQYAISNYELKQLPYPESFDELEIDYHGNKVECETSRINPDHTIYLSKCKVNGKLVKDDKNKDGYYHFGILKMTNQEYVDTYGKNLEDALKAYYDEHNEYPSDYTTLELPPLDKEVSCDVDINPDGTVCLNNCKVDNEDVLDDNNEVYVYGNLYATTSLLKKTNSKSITTYTDGNTHEMYTFEHEATEQTPALTDYRYIGNEPYNYVKFNGDETWRIVGIFDTEDGNGNWDTRIKLIRNGSIGTMSWNSSNVNEWVGSTVQVYLNNTYSINNVSTGMICDVKWYLGGIRGKYVNASQVYTSERGETVFSEDRNINWSGLIGLMYPSDYIYTYALGVDDICYNTPSGCNNSNPSLGWLYYNNNQALISPGYNRADYIFYIVRSGYFNNYNANYSYNVKPVVYLKPNVKIKSGDGIIDNPYEFEL